MKTLSMRIWLLLSMLLCGHGLGWAADQKTFPSPGDATQALVTAVRTNDTDQLLAILGVDSKPLISTGDQVADQQGRHQFLEAYAAAHALMVCTDGSVVLRLGTDSWPFPIPLVQQGTTWRFDTAAGLQDILNRRIGGNELQAVQVCEAYVKAQREYASECREGDDIVQYAQHIHSTAGHHDGLYWAVASGEPLSPLGVLVAQAEAEGYSTEQHPAVYHGYHFHILTQQGEHAAGGAYNYVINGHMVAGFALVAWPDQYGVSGVMTYLVNQNGIIYEKDLGATPGAPPTSYDPDATWKRL